jgi:hypothetical protein
MEKVKVNFEAWLQLLGMVGVLGGLVFVGLEMQQTQKIAIASQVDARSQSQLARRNIWLEGQWELGHKITTTSYDELSDAEKFARNQMLQWQTDIQTNNYFQYRMGLLTEEQWEVVAFRIKWQWQDCSTRHLYQMEALEAPFREYLLSLEDPCIVPY